MLEQVPPARCFVNRLPTRGRLRLSEWLMLAAALSWSALLFAFAALVPIYERSGSEQVAGRPTVVTHSSLTLVEENGSHVLIVIAVPMILTIGVAIALWIRGNRQGAGPFAWTITGSLIAFNALVILTFGIIVLPVTGCLVAACVLHQSDSSRSRV